MGGSSGAGGSADVPSAPTGEALARGDWHVSASNTYFPNTMADYAVDDDRTSCWASGTGQAPGMWFLVDLRAPQFFFEIELLTLAGSTDYPRRLRVSTSTDGKTFSAAANDIAGSTETHVRFDEAKYARYIKLELTHDAGGLWWRIDDLQVRK